MATKKSKILLTERDRRLLRLLFENRGATSSYIREHIFNNKSYPNVARRLKKLRNAKIIGMSMDMNLPSRYFYFIRPEGLKNLYPEGKSLKGLRLKSPNINHDFFLSEIRNILEQSHIIHNYYTENMLRMDNFNWNIGRIFKYDRFFLPDAIFITKGRNGHIYNAIELELNHKGVKRYRDKIQKYYFNRKISYVLLISSSPAVEKCIMDEEKRLYPSGNTKFFYGNLYSLLNKKLPFVFKSCNNIPYTFLRNSRANRV